MGKIKVFLTNDQSAVSSLSVPDFRKVMIRIPTGKKPISSPHMFYRHPCEEHNELAPTVVLPAFTFDKEQPEGNPVGHVKICFLCWALLEKLP